MDNEKRSDDQEYLEAHSLPGTNQAGKGPGERGEKDDQTEPREKAPAHERPVAEKA